MITLVILNWKRPRNVEHIVAKYRTYPCVSEIIVMCNGGLPVYFPEGANSPLLIKCDSDLGLYSRFTAAALARNECVLYVDDDLLVPRRTIDTLFHHWLLDPQRCYGLHGRSGQGAYEMRNVYGDVEVILTRCLLTSRGICSKALTHVHAVDDPAAVPRGNGEDIILSFTAMMYSGRLNEAFDLPYRELEEENDELGHTNVSIHRRWSGHLEHRTEILRRCRVYFGVPLHRLLRGVRELSLGAVIRRAALRLVDVIDARQTHCVRDSRRKPNAVHS